MKKNKLERRVLGRIMAVEARPEELRQTFGASATFHSGGVATSFDGDFDTNGAPYVTRDAIAV